MPVTGLDIPILQQFFCIVTHRTGIPLQPLDMGSESTRATDSSTDQSQPEKPLPKGVVLGPDGKPCRSCTSVRSWMAMSKQKPSTASEATTTSKSLTATPSLDTSEPLLPADCPPDVEQLGRSTWTLLHAMTANYPDRPSVTRQVETRQFMGLLSKMYPCWVCAEDFETWIKGNEPRVSNREEFGKWMCEAHNAVNVKLGKPSFDCNKWEERWRTGWKDGRCD